MLGRTDVGVAGYRKLLRDAIRATEAESGSSQPQSSLNADGVIPTMAGDVIIAVPPAADDVALQKEASKVVGDIIKDTLLLSWEDRPVEIERRVRE